MIEDLELILRMLSIAIALTTLFFICIFSNDRNNHDNSSGTIMIFSIIAFVLAILRIIFHLNS